MCLGSRREGSGGSPGGIKEKGMAPAARQQETPVFKCEHSLFLMMQRGEKQFDMRLWNEADPRIRALNERKGDTAVRFVDKQAKADYRSRN